MYRLFRKCERIHYEIYSEWLRHKDKIKSGDYSDDDIEAIIRTTLNDVDVHNLSKWIQIIKYENWGERLEKDKYSALKDYMKNLAPNFNTYQTINGGLIYEYMFLCLDDEVENKEKYKILFFVDDILNQKL